MKKTLLKVLGLTLNLSMCLMGLFACGENAWSEKQASVGLKYELINVDTEYAVTGIGTCIDTDIVVLSEYNGKPVTSIGEEAFRNCSSLTSVVIGDSVTSIGYDAFSGCNKLSKVYYKGTASDWSKISIDNTYGDNDKLLNATRYYYSETEPTKAGNYWHYDTDGVTILEW